MFTFPQGINNSFQNGQLNFSYAHAALQSLCFLDTTKNLFNFMENNNIRYNNFFPLANELLKIIERVNSGNVPDSQNILFYYGKKYMENQMNIVSKNVLSPDPFHFLYFLFQFLHLETNMSNNYDNTLFNLPVDMLRNDDFVYMQFLMFIIKTQNSIISNDFFNTVRYTYTCQMCGKYFFYGLQNIYRMNVDTIRYFRDKTYPFKTGTNLELSELFTCYSGGMYTKCRNCGNNKCPRYTRICFPGKTIIISLERKNHPFKNDIKILSHFDLGPFISKTRTEGLNLNTIYELKAVISYINFGNDGKYFADCKINTGNMNYIWVRYMDSFFQIIQPNEVCIYEPQILIYEVYGQPIMNNPNIANNINNINFTSNIGQSNFMFNNGNNMNMDPNNNLHIMNNPNTMFGGLMMNNNNNNINMNNFNMMGNANNMMKNQNLADNMNLFQNFSKVLPSTFNNMHLNVSKDNINFPQNNFINLQQQMQNNDQFMQQAVQFNNNNNLPNMKIDLNMSKLIQEISIPQAQMQNQGMMKYFSGDYLAGDQIL